MPNIYSKGEFFRAYFNRASEKDIFLRSVGERFNLPKNSPLKILDIGCHDGALTLKIIDKLSSKIPAGSEFYCIDPSEKAIDDFKNKPLPQNYGFKFFAQTAEQFFAENKTRFDWICASHCFYWSQDLNLAVKNCVD
ncbi:MAG: class I SAM-dependent methyltransferase, partial [Elusimicrobia bacterium]|nr:class I SAM-dependent methyltransferase [Elusimicrobiota bacterium]